LLLAQQCKQLLHALTTHCVENITFVCSVSREERRRCLAPFCAAGFRLVGGMMQDYLLSCGCAMLLIAV
jgi:hypothetical protein